MGLGAFLHGGSQETRGQLRVSGFTKDGVVESMSTMRETGESTWYKTKVKEEGARAGEPGAAKEREISTAGRTFV